MFLHLPLTGALLLTAQHLKVALTECGQECLKGVKSLVENIGLGISPKQAEVRNLTD